MDIEEPDSDDDESSTPSVGQESVSLNRSGFARKTKPIQETGV